MNIRNLKTTKERREALEKELHVTLSSVGSFTLDESIASGRNCENMIGATQIPLGIAGPLRIKSIHDSRITKNECYIPLATTEGALVASVNRGCKAIIQSGGALVRAHKVGATRGPVFRMENLTHSTEFYQFLMTHKEDMQSLVQKTSHHLTLINVTSDAVGLYRFVRFVYDTKDAMGMNMVTFATDLLAKYLTEQTGAQPIALAGNYDIDKKPAWLNFLQHRGTMVWAEVVLSQDTLERILKTTAQKMFTVWLAKCMMGSAMSGSIAFNAQFANIIAALFVATGQDVAHVVEGSLGITTAEVVGKTLYISIYLPDLMIGTVGGGTGLSTQHEALSLLGVAGGDRGENAQKFAEIVGAAVLAGEISLLASLAQGTLAAAHARLGRGQKV